MRWSIIRLIWLRELRDQLRDRRTLFMIVGLPLILYPALGVVVLTFALQFFEKPSIIGLVVPDPTVREFPPRGEGEGATSPAGVAAIVGGVATPQWPGATSRAAVSVAHFTYPPLLGEERWAGPTAVITKRESAIIDRRFKVVWLAPDDATPLSDLRVDLILRSSPRFYSGLEEEEIGVIVAADSHADGAATRPTLFVETRMGDDHSRQALQRIRPLLERWKDELKKVRFVRRGIDAAFDDPFAIEEPSLANADDPERIVDMVIRIFPFMLVMWSLAGALYPAVDLCAGEKERGTMETLLISPAGREEIVLGKFLTIWMFSSASALLNLLSMGLTTWRFSALLPEGTFPLGAIFWCVVLSLPLSALFSAVSLAIGAYARSSKEGQYYLMPLFLVTMPLVFLTLAPGVELNPVYSLIPVTGVALLMQKLMTSPSLATAPWLYFIPVLAPIVLYSALALRWAIDQFQREEVLFREAERVDVSLWLRRLLRDKDVSATTGQAFFCFVLLMALKWLSFGIGARYGPLVQSSIATLAFVATPALMMAVMLNTRPFDSLNFRRPRGHHLALAAILGIFLVPPIVWSTQILLTDFPQLERLLDSPQSFARDQAIWRAGSENLLASLVVFALLPAIGEELAFRGFILTGLRKRYRMRTATFLCSFMNALFHMNVFAFVPVFLVSLVLGLLTLRSKSVLPAILLHFFSKAGLLLSGPLLVWMTAADPFWIGALAPVAFACAAAVFVVCVWLYFHKLPDEPDGSA